MNKLDNIRKIVENKIEVEENIGEISSSSGHLGQIDYYIEEISKPEKLDNGWKVEYVYVTSITTEFTIYPDNPPMENKHKKYIIINEEGTIVFESKKETTYLGNNVEFDL